VSLILNIMFVLFQKVDLLCGVGIKRVCCGTQFTVFLTQDGHVYTCGMDRLIGQPDSRARGHTKPQQVSPIYSTDEITSQDDDVIQVPNDINSCH
jgi:alpha-tubulin suppressor-like RCC1 family protein